MASPSLRNLAADGKEPPEAADVAYGAAVALGFCRIYGNCAVELENALPPLHALLSARELAFRLAQWTEAARRLDSSPSLEVEDHCIDALRNRMDALAACVAVDVHRQCLPAIRQ